MITKHLEIKIFMLIIKKVITIYMDSQKLSIQKNLSQNNMPWELILLICAITISEALGQYLLRLSEGWIKE